MNRVGLGFDAHTFDDDRPLILGGVTIPDSPGLSGHSDADVVSHSIADALLGAAGLGDIGDHFPATDEWQGVDSLVLLRECAGSVQAAGFSIESVDCTVVAQRPRLAPHRVAMVEKLTWCLDLPDGRVSVKATTTDGMGFTGRGEGIGAIAVVLLSAD